MCQTPRRPGPRGGPARAQPAAAWELSAQGQHQGRDSRTSASSLLSAPAPRELQGNKAHPGRETPYDSEISHASASDLTTATAPSHSHFPGATRGISALLAATLSGRDKTTETKVGSVAGALNNASTEQLCHYFVRSYLKDLAYNKLHGA